MLSSIFFNPRDPLEKGVFSPNETLSNGELPIAYAIRHGKHEKVSQLLATGKVDLLKKDDQGLTAVNHALLSGNEQMVALIIGHLLGLQLKETGLSGENYQKSLSFENSIHDLIKIDTKKLSPLHLAAFQNDKETLIALIAAGHSLEDYAYNGWPPLHFAVLQGNLESVKLLAEKGARMGARTQTGETPLHLAALGNSREMLAILLENRLDLHDQNGSGFTPLHFAMTKEQLFNAQFLIERGADPILTSCSELTPLAVMISLAKNRTDQKDPLKFEILPALIFAGVISSWIAPHCPDELQVPLAILQVAGQFAPLLMWGQHANWQQTIGLLVLDGVFNSLPIIGPCYTALKTVNVARVALDKLKVCWRNAGLDGTRALCQGIIHGVNLASSGKTLLDFGNHLYAKLSQPGWITRLSSFLPACILTGNSVEECKQTYELFEANRLATGTRWELYTKEMNERWSPFAKMCKREYSSQDCSRIFLDVEQSHALSGLKKDWTSNFPGRVARWQDFNTNCSLVFAETGQAASGEKCQKEFRDLEIYRYLSDWKWENINFGMSERWKNFKDKCVQISPVQECSHRFLFFDKQLHQNHLQANWQPYISDFDQRLSTLNSAFNETKSPIKTENLFWNLEQIYLFQGNQWGQHINKTFNGFSERYSHFMDQCESTDLKESCLPRFLDFEAVRLSNSKAPPLNVSGMNARWEGLKSLCPTWGKVEKECEGLFWELEKRQATQAIPWQQNLLDPSRFKQIKEGFSSACEATAQNMDLKNIRQCEKIFSKLENERLFYGVKWEDSWSEKWEGIKERYTVFTEECESLKQTAIDCDHIFWENLEHQYYARNRAWDLNNFRDLKTSWEQFNKKNAEYTSEEKQRAFWNELFNLEKNECKVFTEDQKAEILSKDAWERIGLLQKECKDHASLILGLKNDFNEKECKKAARDLSGIFHDDKYRHENDTIREEAKKRFAAISAAQERLCPRSDPNAKPKRFNDEAYNLA